MIADNPFNDPGTGALLPPTQVYPRGRIKDLDTSDCCAVRLTMTVLGTAGQTLTSYVVRDGQEDYRNIDRRVDTSPNAITAVQYDFCRSDGKCATHTITRPPAPAAARGDPDADAGADADATPSPLVDADGDGYPSTTDCSDINNTVHPGAREIPGNGIDDDCSGGDQPGEGAWRRAQQVLGREPALEPEARTSCACATRRRARRSTCSAAARAARSSSGSRTTDTNGEVSLTKLFRKRLRRASRSTSSISRAEHDREGHALRDQAREDPGQRACACRWGPPSRRSAVSYALAGSRSTALSTPARFLCARS